MRDILRGPAGFLNLGTLACAELGRPSNAGMLRGPTAGRNAARRPPLLRAAPKPLDFLNSALGLRDRGHQVPTQGAEPRFGGI
jgi:hypothetical protein